ncbi:MAG: class I SAM-dependent methyltransferase [Actinobacteria bacterium]|nr:MAG: class I SAM-dependent methyltransferase [Actinomycetota bacterium]
MPLGPRRQGSRRGDRRVRYDPTHVASFYDAYGDQEWTRFDDGRTPRPSLEVHLEHLRRFVKPGDHVLDIGAGPGRFSIELARLGAAVTVADISPGQLALNEARVAAEGLEHRVVERAVADVLDLAQWEDGTFDVTVCFGGPLSYILDDAETAVAELVRVTKPGGHVLVSVMSLVGAATHFLSILLDLVRRDGAPKNDEIIRTGLLSDEPDYGHLPMKLYRWSELEALLTLHGTIVAASAAGLLPSAEVDEPELAEFLVRTELALADEPGALSAGQHILAVLRKEP